MATSRHRTLDERVPQSGTSYFYLTGTQNRSQSTGTMREQWDVVGNRHNVNPFESHAITTHRLCLEGEQWNTSHTIMTRKIVSWPIDRVATAVDPRTYWGTLDIGTIQNSLREALSAMSPSEPETSIPTFVAELKDFVPLVGPLAKSGWRLLLDQTSRLPPVGQLKQLPKLIQAYGDTLLQIAGRNYISWRWIVKPMIRDLRTMISFSQAVSKRYRMLRKLGEEGSVRQRASLSNDVYETPKSRVIVNSSIGTVTYADVWTKYEQRIWGTARWTLSPSAVASIPRSDELLLAQAFRLTFGVNDSFQAVRALWEIFPWSWFVDWFNALGSSIALHGNHLDCYWGNAALMRTIRSQRIVDIDEATLPTWVTPIGSSQVEMWEIKERYNDLSLWLPSLPTGLPLVESGRWSILAALSALHLEKGVPRPDRIR